MQIKSVLARGADLTAFGRRGEPAEPSGGTTAAGLPEAAPGLPRTDAVRRILSEYDVTDISPQSLRQLLQRLRQAGALSDKDYQELAAIPGELEREGIRPDEEVDLLRLCREKFAALAGRPPAKSGEPPEGLAPAADLRRRLDWIQKFALIQSGEGAVGMDVAA
jgi:hypothetical protein